MGREPHGVARQETPSRRKGRRRSRAEVAQPTRQGASAVADAILQGHEPAPPACLVGLELTGAPHECDCLVRATLRLFGARRCQRGRRRKPAKASPGWSTHSSCSADTSGTWNPARNSPSYRERACAGSPVRARRSNSTASHVLVGPISAQAHPAQSLEVHHRQPKR
jgi:hypothetical protein